MKKFKQVLWGFVSEFQKNHISEKSATLAFYALNTLAPILLMVVAIGGMFVGRDTIKNSVIAFIDQRTTRETGAALVEMVENMAQTDINLFVFLVGFAILLYGFFLMFGFLRRTLFEIFEVEFRAPKGMKQILRRYAGLVVYMILVFILMVVLLAVNIATPWLFRFSEEVFGGMFLAGAMPFFQFSVVFIMTAGVLAAIYRTMSARTVTSGSAFFGGAVAAFLFSVLNILLALYFAFTEVYTTYGAAGSLVAFLFWVYYVSQVLFIGAQVSKMHSRFFGPKKKLEPDPIIDV